MLEEFIKEHYGLNENNKVYTKIAKKVLSDKVYKQVIRHCKVIEFDAETSFQDIILFGVIMHSNGKLNTDRAELERVFRSGKQSTIDFIFSNMEKSFDQIAIDRDYTEYGK